MRRRHSSGTDMSMSIYKPAHIHLGDFGGDWGVYWGTVIFTRRVKDSSSNWGTVPAKRSRMPHEDPRSGRDDVQKKPKKIICRRVLSLDLTYCTTQVQPITRSDLPALRPIEHQDVRRSPSLPGGSYCMCRLEPVWTRGWGCSCDGIGCTTVSLDSLCRRGAARHVPGPAAEQLRRLHVGCRDRDHQAIERGHSRLGRYCRAVVRSQR